MDHRVDEYLKAINKWQVEMERLRIILLDCQLKEEFKWHVPCYTFNRNNIVLIGKFKDYCALSFFKGVLITDSERILVPPGENSQSVRMIKFTCLEQISKLEPVLKAYIFEAIEIEKAGLKVDFSEKELLVFPEELQKRWHESPAFKKAFRALTPGRQRAYNLYFTAPKQSKTREARIEKYIPRILDGFGINDCTCGLTKKKPGCDGSHKDIQQK